MGLGTSDTSWRIGVAISEDGITFKKSPLNPVMEPRLTNPWESGHVFDPHAFAIGNVIYMGYTGGTVNPLAEQIGVASSVDGINFNRYSTMPIISLGGVGNFDETWTIDPEMILIGNKLHLYYTGHNANGDRQIGLAIAEQGV
ncbi:MAG: hypothetical protein HGJ98_07160 [Desulfosporosinus sp.]|nr:hypothetical protein [Desulfosporosinus sp.]